MKTFLRIAVFSLLLFSILTVTSASAAATPFCGDGFCSAGEDGWCSADCGGDVAPFCGDGFCSAGEDGWCSADCGVPVPPPPAPIPVAPPEPVDNAPSASIAVPRTAAPGSQLSIAVTGTDDNDVAQLQFFDAGNNLLGSFNCAGVQASCSSTFTATAPATQNTAYTFKARSVDNAGQPSAFAVGTGTTTAIPVPPAPVSVSVSILPRPSVRFPLQSLFMRSVSFPDSDCVMPGESALLAVKVQNTGKAVLKDVSFTATVQEAGIYARSGPVSIMTKGRMNRFLRIDVPDDTVEGDYYLRLTVANSRFSRTVHRVFTVGSSC